MSDPAQMELGFRDVFSAEGYAFADCKDMAKGVAENVSDPIIRLHLAQAFCGSVLNRYWQDVCDRHCCSWEIRTPPLYA